MISIDIKRIAASFAGLNRDQIHVLMRKLKEGGEVLFKGKTSAARWFVIK